MAIIVGDGFKLDGAIPLDLNYKWSSYSLVPASIIYEGKLIYDSSSKSVMFHNGTKWNPVCSISSGSSGGTSNYIIKWTGDTSIGNSIIYDTGSFIGIGTKTPNQVLDISGNLNISYTQGKTDKGIIYLGENRFIHTYSDPSRIDTNLFIGIESGNFIMGSSTGTDNIIGASNTGVGRRTLTNNTTGYDNTAIGTETLSRNTTGLRNTAVGRLALLSNTTGSRNTAIGYTSLFNNIDGILNTAIGSASLQACTSGSQNFALGGNALLSLTTGSNNTAIGTMSGYNVTTGISNIFIGYQAGYNELTSNKLYIANSSINNLIYGEFDNKLLQFNANTLKFTGISSVATNKILCYNDTTNAITYSHVYDVLNSLYITKALADTKNAKLTINVTTGNALDTSGNVNIVGNLYATTKSFVIDHPSKPNMKLQYGNLEGPEHGVYIRGKIHNNNIIELPDYWVDLIDEETITVQLTSIGSRQNIWVDNIIDNKIFLNSDSSCIKCFYFIQAERKDVNKIIVEYPC